MSDTRHIKRVKTTCPYCGVGCGVVADVVDDRIIAVSGDESHPANRGRLCVKGTTLAETQVEEGRLDQPMVNGQTSTWDHAIGVVAEGFRATVEKHGPQSVAFYLSGQLLTEDYYVANKLMKGFIGSANVDTNSRLCMSSAVAAHKRAFGEDVVPCNYDDLDSADLYVLVGSNAAWAHPVLYQRLMANLSKRGAKLIVVDPRTTATCDRASMHLPLRPGSDTYLFNGLLSFIQREAFVDTSFIDSSTTGAQQAFDAAHISVEDVALNTGLSIPEVMDFYRAFVGSANVMTLFSQGVNQSVDGTDKGNAIINCHLATAKIGRPGNGPFSLTGQPNAMGGREVGGMANQLAAHLSFCDQDCDKLARFWQAPNLVSGPGLMAVDMFREVSNGNIKAIWIMGTNPVVSLPGSDSIAQALANCPLVVVSDAVRDTDTTRCADVLLPACTWGEKEGSVTNSERVVSRQRRLVSPPGEARSDWRIICDVAAALGYAEAFAYSSAHDIFSEHAALSAFENDGQRLFDIGHLSNLSSEDYEQLQPSVWPATGRPFSDGQYQTDDRRAHFIPVVPAVTVTDELVLNTGRIRDQWHTMTRTGTAAKLFAHQSLPWLDVSPADAHRLGLATGDMAIVTSALTEVLAPIRVSDSVIDGQAFMPMHWSGEFSSEGSVNRLVAPITDPISGQPQLKRTAVSLKKYNTHQVLRVTTPAPMPLSALKIDGVCFWALARVAGGEYGYTLICAEDVSHRMIEQLQDVFGRSQLSSYRDMLSGHVRARGTVTGNSSVDLAKNRAQISRTNVAVDASAEVTTWSLAAYPQLDDSEVVPNDRSSGWQGLSSFNPGSVAASPTVCTCFDVTERHITEAYMAGQRSTEQLGKALRCGTNCGSCLPEINRMVRNLNSAEPKIAGANR